MPVIVDLLLVDEDQRSLEGHLPLAKGVYADLERQLQDSNSHVRRKSAFGALVARGAHVSFLADEKVARPEQPGVVTSVEVSSTSELAVATPEECGEVLSEAVAAGGEALAEASGRGAPPPGAPGGGYATQVPPIMRFPRVPPNRKGTSVGGAWWPGLFDWWPSCTPEPCKALPGLPSDACKISVSESVVDHPCLPLPARNAALEDQAHEAGLGGWPLSIPSAYAAFPAAENCVESAFAPASASASALTSAALRSASMACFRKAAVEVDDEELTVILAPQKGQKWGAGALSEHTPSTASTTLPSPSQQDAKGTLPAFVSYSRLVYPVHEVKALRLWPKGDVARCWPNGVTEDCASNRTSCSLRSADQGPPWVHIAEVTGAPRGSKEEFTTLIALPNAALAKRLLEAVQRGPRRPMAGKQDSGKGDLGAVRCELHMSVDVKLEAGKNSNFAAVVRRGICEACHVGAERVRICGVRDANSEQGGEHSSLDVQPELGGQSPPPSESKAVASATTTGELPLLTEAGAEDAAELEATVEAAVECSVRNAEHLDATVEAAVELSAQHAQNLQATVQHSDFMEATVEAALNQTLGQESVLVEPSAVAATETSVTPSPAQQPLVPEVITAAEARLMPTSAQQPLASTGVAPSTEQQPADLTTSSVLVEAASITEELPISTQQQQPQQPVESTEGLELGSSSLHSSAQEPSEMALVAGTEAASPVILSREPVEPEAASAGEPLQNLTEEPLIDLHYDEGGE